MDTAALIGALGKALTELDAAIRDVQKSSLMNIKPKLERVAALQSAFNSHIAATVADLARDVEKLKGGANG